MRLLLALSLAFASTESTIQALLLDAFYPMLFGLLLAASLGLPLPEDVPLIAAGVMLKTQEGVASWPATLLVALAGIMAGDLVLYAAGRRWGRGVITHRWVGSLLTPARFDRMVVKFHQHGAWMCFFGRFFMGIRAVMCITAGATRFSMWRFLLADFLGALLSVPFFIWLGYKFAEMLPTVKAYMADAQGIALGLLAVGVLVYLVYEIRQRRKARLINLEYQRTHPEVAAAEPVGQPDELISPPRSGDQAAIGASVEQGRPPDKHVSSVGRSDTGRGGALARETVREP